LDPQQVISRATGHFQPCFPASRPVSRPVFASKFNLGEIRWDDQEGGTDDMKDSKKTRS
jgi:hypothetical protein